MTEIPEIPGDKLRNAILIVWFLNKFNETMPIASIRRMAGYQSSGIYSARESGWFREEGGKIVLTSEAELYCEKNILNKFKVVRIFALYAAYTLGILMINEYLILNHGKMLRFNIYSTFFAFIFIVIFGVFFYRFIWIFQKYRAQNMNS